MDAEGRRAAFVVAVVVIWMGGVALFVAMRHQQLDYWPLMISSLLMGTAALFVLFRRHEPKPRRALPRAVDSMPKVAGWSIVLAGLDVANYFFSVGIVGPTIALFQSGFMGVVLVIWFLTMVRRIRTAA